MMQARDVLQVVFSLQNAGVRVWLDGGWASVMILMRRIITTCGCLPIDSALNCRSPTR
jgi:hypothetical protein